MVVYTYEWCDLLHSAWQGSPDANSDSSNEPCKKTGRNDISLEEPTISSFLFFFVKEIAIDQKQTIEPVFVPN